MSYRLSLRAEQKIIGIYEESVDRFGIAQAESYSAGLRRSFDFLAENPEAARERAEVDRRIRAYPYKAHLIVYAIEGEDIHILMLPHARSAWTTDFD